MKGLGTLVLMLLLGVMMPDAAAAGKGALPAGRNASPKTGSTASCNPFKERCDVQMVSRSDVRKMALSKKRFDVLPIPGYMARRIMRRQGGRHLAAHLKEGWAGPRLSRAMNRWSRLRQARRVNRWARLRQARRLNRLNRMNRMIRLQNAKPGLRIDRMRIDNVERMRFN